MRNWYLMTSSTFFLAPALYGIQKGHILLPTTSILSSAISIYYWSNPANPFARTLDLYSAKTAGIVYFAYEYYTIQSVPLRILGYTNLVAMLSSYQLSCYISDVYGGKSWIPFHIAFHVFTSFGQMLAYI